MNVAAASSSSAPAFARPRSHRVARRRLDLFTPDYPSPDREALVNYARASIEHGSKSFAAASRLFDRRTRERVWLLYAWCRACDDLIDAQDHGLPTAAAAADEDPDADVDAARRLAAIRMLTARAIGGAPTGNPAFDALGCVAQETGLTMAMAEDVIAGFALDVAEWRPQTQTDLLRYCFHVAGAVGVMMAVVMGVSPHDDETLERACDLGIAFQLANIARDVAEDSVSGRCYLPADWLAQAGITAEAMADAGNRQSLAALTARLCAMEEGYEAAARVGAARLRFRRRWAVLAAADIYGGIAREVELRGASALDERVTTSRATKLRCLTRSFFAALHARTRPVTAPGPSRTTFAGG